MTSRGKQFDRLALLYLGDVEIFRTSTAEPTTAGIVWTYIKELSQYNSLWKDSQKIIFDLGNIVNDVYTASFNTTLTAHFSYQGAGIRVADQVLPISATKSKSGAASAFNVPADNTSVSYKIPSTVSRAVVAISACGQSQEEFWWSNVFSSDTDSFATTVGELYGYSPFREIQLYIDGLLAGVVWPFPVIFTGGVAPGFWRPIVGIDAFDLRSSEIDISPFLPMIRDGNSHSFEIRVFGLDVLSDGSAVVTDTVGSYWVVTGNIFLYEDEAGGSDEDENDDEESAEPDENSADASIQIITPEPNFHISRKLSQNATGGNDTLEYSVLAERTVEIKSSKYSWTQTLSFSNYGFLNQQGYSQSNKQLTTGNSTIKDLSASSDLSSSSNETSFKYPLLVNSTYGITPDTLKIDAWMKRGLEIHSSGDFALSGYTFSESTPSRLITSMSGKAKYKSGPGGGSAGSISKGTTVAEFEGLLNGKSYTRSVRAVNGDVVYDTYPKPRPRLRSGETEVQGSGTGTGMGVGRDSVRSMLGRGPGKLKMETRGSEREL